MLSVLRINVLYYILLKSSAKSCDGLNYSTYDCYCQEKKLCAYPWLEVYSGGKINFMAPLSRQNEFSVPESIAAAADDKLELENDRPPSSLHED